MCSPGFFVPFIYLIDKAVETGYSKGQAAILLSILGITNTVGRVLAGWVSDRPWADCLLINNLALVVGGISTTMVPLCTHYWMLATYASIFGMCIGTCTFCIRDTLLIGRVHALLVPNPCIHAP